MDGERKREREKHRVFLVQFTGQRKTELASFLNWHWEGMELFKNTVICQIY